MLNRQEVSTMVLKQLGFGMAVAISGVALNGCMVVHLMSHGGGSQVLGTGPVTTENRSSSMAASLRDVTAIDASAGIKLNVTVGGEPSISVETNKNLLSHLTTVVKGHTLTIGFDTDVRTNNETKVTVVLANVASIALSGAVQADIAGLNTDRFEAQVGGASKLVVEGNAKAVDAQISGAGHILFKHLDADTVKIEGSGAAMFAAFGSTNSVDMVASGGSNVALVDLKSKTAKVDVSEGSDVEVYASDSLNATASGGAHVRYAGSPPKVERNASGGSSIESE